MASEPHERAEFDQDKMILNCKNCFVDLNEHEVIKNPDQIYSLFQINTKYNPKAGRSEIFETMISQCTSKHELLLEIIACSLTRQEINPGQIVMMIGDTDNGKSTLIRILKAIFGTSVISSIDLQDIQHDTYAEYQLEHKLLNISGDLPENTPLKTFNKLKKITTTGEMSSVHDKKIRRHEADIYATLLFSCNELPDLPAIANSIFKRLTVIPFPNKFKKDDEFIKQFITEEEKSKILNTLLYYLDRVVENGGDLTNPQQPEETKELWRTHADTGTLFILTKLRRAKDNEKSATVTAVYTELIKFCKLKQKPQPTPDQFNQKMLKLGYEQYNTTINHIGVRCWRDVVFQAKDDDQTTLTSNKAQNTTKNNMGQAQNNNI